MKRRLTIREQRLLIGLARLLAQFNGRAEPDTKDRKLAERLLRSRGGPLAPSDGPDEPPMVESLIG